MIHLTKEIELNLRHVLRKNGVDSCLMDKIVSDLNNSLRYGYIEDSTIFGFLMKKLGGVDKAINYMRRNNFIGDGDTSCILKNEGSYIKCYLYVTNNEFPDLKKFDFIKKYTIDVTGIHCSGRYTLRTCLVEVWYDKEKFNKWIKVNTL